MESIVVGTVSVIVGIALVVFNERFARFAMAEQNRVWGFHFGEREVRITRYIAVLCGLVFVILGVITVAGILPLSK
jgi:hypothetical protein